MGLDKVVYQSWHAYKITIFCFNYRKATSDRFSDNFINAILVHSSRFLMYLPLITYSVINNMFVDYLFDFGYLITIKRTANTCLSLFLYRLTKKFLQIKSKTYFIH